MNNGGNLKPASELPSSSFSWYWFETNEWLPTEASLVFLKRFMQDTRCRGSSRGRCGKDGVSISPSILSAKQGTRRTPKF